MKRLSLEESLKILAPIIDNEEVEEIKKPTRKTRRKVKTPSRSPVRIPKITPVKNFKEEKIETIENKKTLYEEEEEKIEIENKTTEVAPHTPTRFTIDTPKTPVNKFEEKNIENNLDLNEKLKNYRYSIIKYLIDEDTNSINYVVCFDPNGQLIFVNLDKKANINCQEHKMAKIIQNENIPKLGSYQNALLEKLTFDMKGIVFYDDGNYLFAIRDDKADYNYQSYSIEEHKSKDMLSMTQTYLIASLEELEKEPQYMIQSSKKNYQIIQQQQLLSNKTSFSHLIESMEKLNKQMKSFDKAYKKYSDNLVDDWSLLGSFAKDFYDKYGKGKLNDIDKNKFDQVSVNMYARFQNFNEHIFMIQDLIPLCDEINKITNSLSEKQEIIQTKDKLYSGKIIEPDEINNLI